MNERDTDVRPTLVVDQQLALALYLESLLAEKPAMLPVPVRPAIPVRRPVIDLPATAVRAEVAPADVAVTRAQTVTETRVEAPVARGTVPAAASPDWADGPFPSLLLKVQGLSLALPLVKLSRILPWSDPTPLPGYPPWFLGVLRHADRTVQVVETAVLVMPENRRPPATATGAAAPATRHIVLIDDGRWGLVCDEVSSVVTLDPQAVRWRSRRTQRPWLAGTVVAHLCALLDADRLAALLDAGCPSTRG